MHLVFGSCWNPWKETIFRSNGWKVFLLNAIENASRTFDRLLSSLLTEMDGLYTDVYIEWFDYEYSLPFYRDWLSSVPLLPLNLWILRCWDQEGLKHTSQLSRCLLSNEKKLSCIFFSENEFSRYSIEEIKQYLDPTIVVDDLIQSLVERTDEYRVNDIISIFQRAKYDAFKHCHDDPVIRQENIDSNVFRVSHDPEVSE